MASPHTLRKVDITAEQLGRRYNLIYGQQLSVPESFSLLKVAKWYAEQNNLVKVSLENVEPFTWLKHFEKGNLRPQDRIPWHLSALVMEEFLNTSLPKPELKISEIQPTQESSPDLSLSPNLSVNLPGPSRTSSRFSLGPSLSRHISADGRISFEPLLEPVRTSLESRRSAESVVSSLVSASSAQHRAVAALPSPASSRLHLHDGLRKRLAHDSDDAYSARNSVMMDHSDDNGERSGIPPEAKRLSGIQPDIATSSRRAADHTGQPDDIPSVTILDMGPDEVPVGPSRLNGRQALHISIPSEDHDLEREIARRREAEEAQMENEYHLKTQ